MTERGGVGKIEEWRGEQKGGERSEMGDEGMLALRRGHVLLEEEGQLGWAKHSGRNREMGVRRGAAGGGTKYRRVSKEEGFLD